MKIILAEGKIEDKYTKKDCDYHFGGEDRCMISWQKSCRGCKYYGDCARCEGSGRCITTNLGVLIGPCQRCNGTGKYKLEVPNETK